MNHVRRNFIVRNEGFVCANCGLENTPLRGGCRNHCRQCLYSRHVDQQVPGDRASVCLGLMRPISIEPNSKKGQILGHQCQQCGETNRNKVAKDDNIDAIIELSINVNR